MTIISSGILELMGKCLGLTFVKLFPILRVKLLPSSSDYLFFVLSRDDLVPGFNWIESTLLVGPSHVYILSIRVYQFVLLLTELVARTLVS